MDINIIIGIGGLILAVVGILYSQKTYKKDHIDKTKEENFYLLVQFKANQTMARQTYGVLHKFATHYNAFDSEFVKGEALTYRMCMDEIKKTYEKGNLSDALYAQLQKSKLPSIQIQSHLNSLATQHNALNEIYQKHRILTQYF